MNDFRQELSQEELKEYPVRKFEGEIFLVDSISKLPAALSEMAEYSVLGFDTETRPAFRKGVKNKVALLQLASHDKAWLFRLNMIGLPDSLKSFLSKQTIIKPGVAIHDDIKGLNDWNSFKPGGFVELQDMVKDYGIVSSGLKKLSAIVLGFAISKRQQVTNWENSSLSDAQLAYAATDAWVCLQIYDYLLNGKA
ncbi:MAG: 3'-5' exonuclease [Marinilabiliaceae bacterium]|jgi:ribonuclease D|nr:3'-5' exonuclease [Marinilabiliaceae bacterium]